MEPNDGARLYDVAIAGIYDVAMPGFYDLAIKPQWPRLPPAAPTGG